VIDLIDEEGEKVSLDARPSDAIALALRTDSPMYVDQKVLDLSSANIVEEGKEEEGSSEEEWPDVIG
jgi:bifunctional DNase/RNase